MLCVYFFFSDRVRPLYLPDGTDWQIRFSLSGAETGLREDTEWRVRSLDGKTFLACPPGFRFRHDALIEEVEIQEEMRLVVCNEIYAFTLIMRRFERSELEYRKYLLPKDAEITIGRASCMLQIDDSLVSEQHATLTVAPPLFTDHSTNGSYINGEHLLNSARLLTFGDKISIPTGLSLVYLGDCLAVSQPKLLQQVKLLPWQQQSAEMPEATEREASALLARAPESVYVQFHRAPRMLLRPNAEPVDVESPVNKNEQREQPWFLTLGPSLTMALPMGASILAYSAAGQGMGSRLPSMITIVASSVLAVFWGVTNTLHRKRGDRTLELKRRDNYRKYIQELEAELQARFDVERRRLTEVYPDTDALRQVIETRAPRLWDRMPVHEDFLRVRMGRGDVPFPGEIKIPKERLSLIDDPLRDLPTRILSEYSILRDMPVTVSLRDTTLVGLVGGMSAQAALQSIMLQIATLHSYHDVKLVALYPEEHASEWQWVRWLGHAFANEERGLRLTASHTDSLQAVLSHLDDVISMRLELSGEERSQERSHAIPHYVVCCASPEIIENTTFLRRLIYGAPGFSLLVVAPQLEDLPKECSIVYKVSENEQALYEMSGIRQTIRGEWFPTGQMEAYARRLAPVRVREASENAAIPSLVMFLSLYGVRRAEELDVWRLWSENHVYDGLKSMIGLGAGGVPFVLDISEKVHGPHGLVAGTTGSGKSVTLQTYILSLALNYAPSELQFILIDYKGGGMAAAFAGLPHLAGTITNLDGNMIDRALVSIQAEVNRRQRLFKQVDVDHIDTYIRQYNHDPAETPLSHLIIITDEFAELKMDKPDFMAQLVQVSRVGRSLGIHLILATQKPANSVSDEIAANSRFKICMRVQDRSDSTSMLRRPDAAYLKGMGRCYVQVGNDELFQQVQTSYAGARYRPDEPRPNELAQLLDEVARPVPRATPARRRRAVDASGNKDITEMGAVIERVIEVARVRGVPFARRLWLDVLDSFLFAESAVPIQNGYRNGIWPDSSTEIMPCVGLIDDLAAQQRRLLSLPLLQTGNLLICGLPGTGKTTFMQTLAVSLCRQYTPEQVQLYVMSLTSQALGMLKSFPHVGDVVFSEQPTELNRLISLLERENLRRRDLLGAENVEGFSAYNRALARRGAPCLPLIVVMVDRMQQVREDIGEAHRSRLFKLFREASGRGILFAATAMTPMELPSTLGAVFQGIALQLNDRGDYREVLNVKRPVVQSEVSISTVAGRGLVYENDRLLEYQTFLHGNADDEETRAAVILCLAGEMDAAWHGARPVEIPRIPEMVSLGAFLSLSENAPAPYRLPLGYGVAEGLPLELDLKQQFTWLIYGGRRSGKTTALTTLMHTAVRSGAEICVIAGLGALYSSAARLGVPAFQYADPGLVEALTSLQETMKARAAERKQRMLEGGEAAVFEWLDAVRPIVVLIDELDRLQQSAPESVLRFLSFTAEAAQFGISIFAAVNPEPLNKIASLPLPRALIDAQRALLIGGQISPYVCPWSNIPLSSAQKAETLPPGHGWLYCEGTAEEIILPQLDVS